MWTMGHGSYEGISTGRKQPKDRASGLGINQIATSTSVKVRELLELEGLKRKNWSLSLKSNWRNWQLSSSFQLSSCFVKFSLSRCVAKVWIAAMVGVCHHSSWLACRKSGPQENGSIDPGGTSRMWILCKHLQPAATCIQSSDVLRCAKALQVIQVNERFMKGSWKVQWMPSWSLVFHGFSYMASHISATFARFHDVPSFAMLPRARFPLRDVLSGFGLKLVLHKRPSEKWNDASAQNNRSCRRRNFVAIARGKKSCMLTSKWHGFQIPVQSVHIFLVSWEESSSTSLCMTCRARRIRASLPSGRQSAKNLKHFFLGEVVWVFCFPSSQ